MLRPLKRLLRGFLRVELCESYGFPGTKKDRALSVPGLICCKTVTGRKTQPDCRIPDQADMALTRFARRETLRLAVFLCIMPFWAVRTRSGCAAFNAASALARSPEAIASSTERTSVLTRERRALLTSVRVIIWRAAFLADDVLAIVKILLGFGAPDVLPIQQTLRRNQSRNG